MMKGRYFWYRRILTMAVIALSMVLFSVSYNKNQSDRTLEVTQDGTKLYVGGFTVGIYLETEGALVVGTDVVTGEDGLNYDPAYGKIKAGDYIVALNNINVSAKSQLSFLVNKYGDEDITLTLKRGNEIMDVVISPVAVGNGEYKIGAWVKDDSQGIGTVTYITNTGDFGALGHGISDTDTKELLGAENGRIYVANIWGITKGRAGSPGSLCGSIDYEESMILGAIEENCNIGIYGNLSEYKQVSEIVEQYGLKPAEICARKDVKLGQAYIRCSVDDQIKDYEIEITELKKNVEGNKGIVLKVVDEELLEITGGIVQGMSGSPILQNGKIIGAVTHVFVRDSKLGYGIFIEEMLED